MKLCVVTSSISRVSGGLQNSASNLNRYLSLRDDMLIHVHTGYDQYTAEDEITWSPLLIKPHLVIGPKSFCYTPSMIAGLNADNPEIIHCHGLWQYQSFAVNRWRKSSGKPYIVTPHGMLDPWAIRNSNWKKRLASIAYQDTHLRSAAVLHALCRQEFESIRSLNKKFQVCIIPNGINLVEDLDVNNKQRLTECGKKTLLFLGRLHPKKGLINALKAWSLVLAESKPHLGNFPWRFVIAGWNQGDHMVNLKHLCDVLGLKYNDISSLKLTLDSVLNPSCIGAKQIEHASVVFTGPVFGKEKDLLLRRSDAFILPSVSEGLPMSVLEAWAYNLPVLITDQCNLLEGFDKNAAIRIGTDVSGIAEGMRKIVQLRDSELSLIGKNGRELVKSKFAWPQIAIQMREVYNWVLGGGAKPDSLSL
jgi:glycosyltransferase involved in cell wall biosynthesis